MTDLVWDDLDKRAVDTARILAADAVEKVGNGHPGTAMSLAPAVLDASMALYQRIMFGPGGLTRRQREMLAVVTSRANDCHY